MSDSEYIDLRSRSQNIILIHTFYIFEITLVMYDLNKYIKRNKQ